jgi:hypothetical protein
MDQRFSDYLTQYKNNYTFTETECQKSEVCGVRITVTLYEYDTESEHRDRAGILLEKDGLRYECEGIERPRWEFYPVTVDGCPCILFSKTLYGFTLLDAETLTEITDFFPEKVMNGEESFIITHAQSFGKYLILDGCYWGAPYEFAALDPAQMRFVSLTEAYGVFAGDHTARIQGDELLLKGENLEHKPAEITVRASDLNRLMTERGTTDF